MCELMHGYAVILYSVTIVFLFFSDSCIYICMYVSMYVYGPYS
jgi:hypothetical protein